MGGPGRLSSRAVFRSCKGRASGAEGGAERRRAASLLASVAMGFLRRLCLLGLPLLLWSPNSMVPTVYGQEMGCQKYTNKTCEECLKNVTCLWCSSSKKCVEYPVRNILPPSSLCELSSARWGVCWVNFEALIITMSVAGGIILLTLFICCCFCCRKKKNRKVDKEDEKAAREQEQRRVRQEERRAEMKSRHDEIRKKYGLFKEENPYAKFENN